MTLFALPATSAPIANYVPAVRTGNLIFLSGHIPRDADNKVIAGKVGRDATEKDAQAAARTTALALLATLKREIGDLSKVKRIIRVGGFVNAVGALGNVVLLGALWLNTVETAEIAPENEMPRAANS